jgi:hypothetical protein
VNAIRAAIRAIPAARPRAQIAIRAPTTWKCSPRRGAFLDRWW